MSPMLRACSLQKRLLEVIGLTDRGAISVKRSPGWRLTRPVRALFSTYALLAIAVLPACGWSEEEYQGRSRRCTGSGGAPSLWIASPSGDLPVSGLAVRVRGELRGGSPADTLQIDGVVQPFPHRGFDTWRTYAKPGSVVISFSVFRDEVRVCSHDVRVTLRPCADTERRWARVADALAGGVGDEKLSPLFDLEVNPDRRAEDALVSLLQSSTSSPTVRMAVISALQALPSVRAMPDYITLLADEGLSARAAHALHITTGVLPPENLFATDHTEKLQAWWTDWLSTNGDALEKLLLE